MDNCISRRAELFACSVIGAGGVSAAIALLLWKQPVDPLRYLTCLALGVCSAGLKFKLPGIAGTFSLSFLFILVGIADFSFSETVILGGLAAATQSLWHAARRPTRLQVLFNIANVAASAASAYGLAHLLFPVTNLSNLAILLPFSASIYFVTNTLLVSGVISLVEHKPIAEVWAAWFLCSFPYYLVGAAGAGLISVSSRSVNWQSSLFALPILYLIHVYYRLRLRHHPPVA